MLETLRTVKQNGVGWIFFNRPEVRNAVNRLMMEELEEVLHSWSRDGGVKVLVFAGDERTFVSGGDLVEFQRMKREDEVYPVMRRMGGLLEKIRNLNRPTVAAVRGTAVGGGCEIAATCDFRLASPGTRFGFIQSRLGITSGWGGGSRLLEQLPRDRALYLLLSGERVEARKLHRWGWIFDLYPEEDFLESVQAFAESLTRAPMGAIQAYMEIADAFREQVSREELIDREARHCARLWETEEHLQAVDAFLRRTRKPNSP
ncbi:enoyl-CoA hydratase/carnithine racemase [Melghirimyces profundicolus]|uniref:Enoyl-CoA hydratase/carnithine racemase n=1 Tax=Melghirimyces profundicolus TaxID=1242148 RepID=A0A2T6C9T9_9BACL|nr:enoyl-CoA hydratase/isomerase family protein [Melghirimyces profundicolus]PTX65081.1 enoyl-CoA hydratase/carnithine racemase [Melghirimyces profundicolus]